MQVKNLIILFAVGIFLCGAIGIYLTQKSASVKGELDLEATLPTGPYMRHIVYEPYAEPWTKITLNGMPSTDDDLYELIRKYKEYSSPENITYKEKDNGRVIIIDIYWRLQPSRKLATFEITKEKPGLGTEYRCTVYECQI
ncbi:hypothetical protein HXX02_00245 [Microbulbifer elongatus]|uniref:Uncharacterized protein n=1 Tax=Microbulbifer elongatus TaxID=86173 RepID=A0ABT1NVE2_9GAMM|nr:hypothetical protein [Microbulbifer elongatus]MCQ3827865.1 hypothetical protein [Microbulbifer elongatus]